MAKKNEMGLNNYPFNSINPFLTGIVDDIVAKKTRKVAGFKFQDVVNQETGEIDTQTMLILGTKKEVEDLQKNLLDESKIGKVSEGKIEVTQLPNGKYQLRTSINNLCFSSFLG